MFDVKGFLIFYFCIVIGENIWYDGNCSKVDFLKFIKKYRIIVFEIVGFMGEGGDVKDEL